MYKYVKYRIPVYIQPDTPIIPYTYMIHSVCKWLQIPSCPSIIYLSFRIGKYISECQSTENQQLPTWNVIKLAIYFVK